MAVSDNRLTELAAIVDRGETVPLADARELVIEALNWRSKFCQLITEVLEIKKAFDRCVHSLSDRHTAEAQALRGRLERLARLGDLDLDYLHDEDLGRHG